jgi:hypothetical protein
MKKRLITFIAIAFALGLATTNRVIFSQARTQLKPAPQYTKDGELVRPTGYKTWTFVGADVGLTYAAETSANTPRERDRHKATDIGSFHNIYISTEAYDHYLKTGKFPDKTVLVMDVYEAKRREPQGIVNGGYFEADPIGFEVAVKNLNRPDGSKTPWAYYIFQDSGGPLMPTAKAQPDSSCYDCHKAHADDDNVWVQFYPTLRPIQEQKR